MIKLDQFSGLNLKLSIQDVSMTRSWPPNTADISHNDTRLYWVGWMQLDF